MPHPTVWLIVGILAIIALIVFLLPHINVH
jgi:hypothetical protein